MNARRSKVLLISLLLSVLFLFSVGWQYEYQIRNTISYATRPLWDHADGPRTIVPHYYVEGMRFNDQTCALHGWEQRKGSPGDIRVLDAVLMSSELDLLEVRLHELSPVVDRFFILESNATFTGLPKPTYFADNLDRFADFAEKIEYNFIPGYPLQKGQDAWDVEATTRGFMTTRLREYVSSLPPASRDNTLVIMSDIDEIPSRHTISLLRACNFGTKIHLLMRNFLYSFEWYIGMNSWRASMHQFILPGPSSNSPKIHATFYRHSMSTDIALADAGWHCSYCFRTLPEYTAKMRGFSHHDRIGGNEQLLDERRIQSVICKGDDIFGMLPEAYTYGDLLSQLHLQPSHSAVHLPHHIVEKADNFRFLLPGGCLRESD